MQGQYRIGDWLSVEFIIKLTKYNISISNIQNSHIGNYTSRSSYNHKINIVIYISHKAKTLSLFECIVKYHFNICSFVYTLSKTTVVRLILLFHSPVYHFIITH